MSRKKLTIGTFLVSKESIIEQMIQNLLAKNAAPVTMKNYRKTWQYFTSWYQGDISDISNVSINGWIVFLKQKNITVTTINSYLTHLRTVINFMISERYIKPFKIHLLKQQEVTKETYSNEELKKLLVKPDISKCSFPELRNWVIINTLLGTGIRRSTIVNLKLVDIDLKNGFMNMSHTKNKKVNIVPLSSTLVGILKDYLMIVKLPEGSYLFPDMYGAQMKVDRLSHIVAIYNRRHGVSKISSHAFRHTYAKLMIVNGCNVFKLQKLLGHSSLEMTRRYVDLFSVDLKEGYDDINPLENFTTHKNRITI